jgi:predicted permease
MRFLNRLTGAWRAIVHRDRVDTELEEELREYLEASIAAGESAGHSREEATRRARAEMGSRAAVMDWVRDIGWESRLESIWQDVRYAVRMQRRSPGFAATAILTCALGIGTNLAIFTLADGMLFRPLPYRDPERLVLIQSYSPTRAQAYNMVLRVDVEQLRAYHSGLEDIAAVRSGSAVTLAGRDGAETMSTSYATPNLLELLGVGAHVGRPLRPGDELTDPRPAMLTFDAWRQRFGGDPAIVGRTVAFDQLRVRIVGVLPARFIYPMQGSLGDGEILLPRALDPAEATNPRAGVLSPIGRLRRGVSLAAAQSEIDVLVRQAARNFPTTPEGRAVRVANLQYALFELSRSLLWLLVTAAGGVLLIVCVNLAGLLIARGTTREREIGVRTAIGASRLRVARQLVVESLVLAFLAGIVTLLCAAATFDLFAAQVPPIYRRLVPEFDARTIAITLVMSTIAGALFGIVPAWRLTRAPVIARIQRATRMRRSRRFLGHGVFFLTAEVAVCLILLTATALTANSLIRRRTVDLGFSHTNVMLLRVVPPASRYPAPQAFDFQQRALAEVRRLPGVVAAGIDSPQVGRSSAPTVVRDDLPAGNGVWSVTPGYFSAMGIPVIGGREFDESDAREDAAVALVNETAARLLWPGQPPIGQLVDVAGARGVKIIGVVRDVRSEYGGEVRPSVYRPITRARYRGMTIVARGPGDPTALATALRTVVQRLDLRVVVPVPRTVAETLKRGIADSQFQTSLFALFGLVGLLVAAVGIYGVTAHWVGSRTRELGVRLALGADPMRLEAYVLTQASAPLLAGLAAGLLGAFVLTRQLRSLLYGITPHDPLTYAIVVTALIAVGLGAAYLPARRAARVDPMTALRAE